MIPRRRNQKELAQGIIRMLNLELDSCENEFQYTYQKINDNEGTTNDNISIINITFKRKLNFFMHSAGSGSGKDDGFNFFLISLFNW